MEQALQDAADYGTRLLVERWAELAVLLVMIALWRWFTGHEFRKRIAALEDEENNPTIVIDEGGDVTVIHGDQHIHYYIDGPAEILQPKTGRAIPLRVQFAPGIATGERFEARLIGPDGEVKDRRSSEEDGSRKSEE